MNASQCLSGYRLARVLNFLVVLVLFLAYVVTAEANNPTGAQETSQFAVSLGSNSSEEQPQPVRPRRSPGGENDLEFAGKGEDGEGGTWYLGKRSFFIGLKNQKGQAASRSATDLLLSPGQWQYKRPTTVTPAYDGQTLAKPAESLPLPVEAVQPDARSFVTESPQSKRSRSPWGFHRSTKAAWYLGKRSLVPFNTVDEETLNAETDFTTSAPAVLSIPSEMLRAAKIQRGKLRLRAINRFSPLKGRDSKWNLWYLGKRSSFDE